MKASRIKKSAIYSHIEKVTSSDRFRLLAYPAISTAVLTLLTIFGVSGSSIGVYHQIFYGSEATDSSLIANSPRGIRSDEWTVGTQKIISQAANDYKTINQNVGDGEDVIALSDVPARDWSLIFRPHNIGFFILPFENAFALRWWLPLFLLSLAVYSFSLTLLKKRYLLSALLSVAFCASPFFHWWYGYSTFAIAAFALFGATSLIKLLSAKHKITILLHSLGVFYSGAAFVLAFYPPFQIPVILAIVAFAAGYFLEYRKIIVRNLFGLKLTSTLMALALALAVSAMFFLQHKPALESVANTAYPGERVVASGGYSMTHFLSSPYSPIFQNDSRASSYIRPSAGAVNSSESANFILLAPLLIPMMLYLILIRCKRHQGSWLLIIPLVMAALFAAWMFVPGLSILGKISLLSMVPHARLLIGWGVLSIIMTIVFIRYTLDQKQAFSLRLSLTYSILIYLLYIVIGFRVSQQFPDFLGIKGVFIYGAVLPIIVFLTLRRHALAATFVLAAFSLYSVVNINPIYHGLDVITKTPILSEIKSTNEKDPGTWASDSSIIENFPSMSGARSLTGTFLIPQNSLWDGLGIDGQRDAYNRYAHVSFVYDRVPGTNEPTQVIPSAPDQFRVLIEPCSDFYIEEGVKYIITSTPFSDSQAPCLLLSKTVIYPLESFYIYKMK